MASVGWIFGQRQNRKLSRLEHTFNVLNSYRHNQEHWDAIQRVIVLAKNKTLPMPEEAGRENAVAVLRKLLVHYEFIAVGVFSGGLDETMIRECDRGNIVNLYKNSQNFIKELRRARKRPTIYRNLQDLAERWEGKKPRWPVWLIEICRMKPFRPWKMKNLGWFWRGV